VVGIQNIDLNSKFSISVKCGPLSSVVDFSELIVIELDYTPKIEIVSYDILYKCANLHKICI
jgi:hypothetical protein